MRTTQQVAIYCAFREGGRIFYILLKRTPNRGSFWQPVTGGKEDFDGHSFQAVIREVKEELGVDITKKDIFEIPHSFSFVDKEGIERQEQCFSVILPSGTKDKIRLSEEHTAIIYSTDVEYLKSLLKFEENRIGFDKFVQLLSKKDATKKINNQTS